MIRALILTLTLASCVLPTESTGTVQQALDGGSGGTGGNVTGEAGDGAGGNVYHLLGAPVDERVGVVSRRFENHDNPDSSTYSSGINPENVDIGKGAIWWGLESNYQVAPGAWRQAEGYLQFYPPTSSPHGSKRPFHSAIRHDTGKVTTFLQQDQLTLLTGDGQTQLAMVQRTIGGEPDLSVWDGGFLTLRNGGYIRHFDSTLGYRTLLRLQGGQLKVGAWTVDTFTLASGTCEERLAAIEAGLVTLGLAASP